MTAKPNNQPEGRPSSSAAPDAAGAAAKFPDFSWIVAGCGNALEAVALIALAGMSAYGVIAGSASTTSRALTEAVMLLVLAVGVGLLAHNMFRRKSLAKTPTLLWNFMLLPVGYSLVRGGAPGWGVLTIVVAVLTFAAALFVPRYDYIDEAEDKLL